MNPMGQFPAMGTCFFQKGIYQGLKKSRFRNTVMTVHGNPSWAPNYKRWYCKFSSIIIPKNFVNESLPIQMPFMLTSKCLDKDTRCLVFNYKAKKTKSTLLNYSCLKPNFFKEQFSSSSFLLNIHIF